MPRVPTVDGPSVQLAAAPDAYQNTPRALGAAGQVQADMFAQGAQVAGAAADLLQRQRDEFDQLRVDDALNTLKERQTDLTFGQEKGFTAIKGRAALERPSGQPLAEEYTGELQRAAGDLANGLTDRQRRLFQLRANDLVTGFRSQVMRYEGEQAQAYGISVREGTIANRQDEIGRFWNDPTRIDEGLSSIGAAVADLGRRQGMAAAQIEARTRAETSKAISGAVANAMEQNNFVAASTLLQQYSDRMEAADLVRSRALVDKQLDAAVGMQTATAVMRDVTPKMAPTDWDRVVGITVQSESGGNPNAVSPKGAKGVMQVMDATNRDPGFGVRPAADDSPAERARVGRDYLGAMVKRYGGDLAQAWAAYNAGPGAVDKALEQANSPDAAKRGRAGNWLGYLPQETQDYVAKNMKAYDAGAGAPQKPTLQEVHAAVRQRLGDSNPVRLKTALDESTRQYEDAQKAVKQRDDEALANAQRWLAANGGRFSLMPAALRAAVPPGQLDNLLQFSDRIAKGEDRTNPAVYQQLSDPATLRSLSDNEFYVLSTRELSEADRKHFAQERAKAISGVGGDKPGDLNSEAVNRVLAQRFVELGIDPKKDAQRAGAIRQYVDRSLLAAQQAAGRRFDDAATGKHIDSLFAQTGVTHGWLGLTSTSGPMLAMKSGDIPSAVRDRLKADFKAAGIDDPTDAQMLGAYWTARDAAARRRITPLPKGSTGG